VNESIKSEKACINSSKKGGVEGLWLNNRCVINPDPESENPVIPTSTRDFTQIAPGRNKVTIWVSQ
jgi:hypothetical protein